jgi:hypothetical protein
VADEQADAAPGVLAEGPSKAGKKRL